MLAAALGGAALLVLTGQPDPDDRDHATASVAVHESAAPFSISPTLRADPATVQNAIADPRLDPSPGPRTVSTVPPRMRHAPGVALHRDENADTPGPRIMPSADRSGQSAQLPQPITGDAMTIAGRVLDDSGVPLGGILIEAMALRLFEPDETIDSPSSTVSAVDGSFTLLVPADGEYYVATRANATFAASHAVVAGNGVEAVKFTLIRLPF